MKRKNLLIGFMMVALFSVTLFVFGQETKEMDLKSLLGDLNIWKIATFIAGLIGLSGFGLVGLLWSVIKEGREASDSYEVGKKDGWTEKEKDDYIKQSGEFWEAVKNFSTAIKSKFKKLFKRK